MLERKPDFPIGNQEKIPTENTANPGSGFLRPFPENPVFQVLMPLLQTVAWENYCGFPLHNKVWKVKFAKERLKTSRWDRRDGET